VAELPSLVIYLGPGVVAVLCGFVLALWRMRELRRRRQGAEQTKTGKNGSRV